MANQTQILNVSDEMKLNDNVQMKNVKEQEENMYSSSSDTTEELCSSSTTDAYRVRGCTTSGRYVRILDLREGNEESSEETTGCKASVYAEFDDCPRVGKFVKLLDFRHFERHMMFSQSDRKTYKKAISDGVNVSVVLDVGCGNT